jgi:intracellular septation protein A
MQRIRAAVEFAFWEFGPLILLLTLSAWFGLKVAIAGTIAFVIVDATRRFWWHLPFTRVYLLSSSLAVIFGTIDLFSQTPFMLKYEAVITNVATGFAFVAGARGTRPLLQELAEQRSGTFPDRADIRQFFRLFTLFWAGYFFAKAGLYLWIGSILPLGRAMLIRSVLGGVSLAIMIVVSITQGRRLFVLCSRLGLLPAVEEPQSP